MTFTDIKRSLENVLKNFTPDDLHVVSHLQVAKQEFGETLGWRTDADVKAWLTKDFKNLDASVHAICSAKEISDALKEIDRKTQRAENLIKEIKNREEVANKRSNDMSSDFTAHKISHKEYQEKNKQLEAYKQQTSELRKTKRVTEVETKGDKEKLRGMKRTAKVIAGNKTEFFKNEKQSLEFLFKVLFLKEISVQPLEGFVQRHTELIFNMDELDPAITANTREYEKTMIDYQLIKTNLELKEVTENSTIRDNSSRIVPQRWKTILEETFANPIPDMFGSLCYVDVHDAEYDSDKNNGFCFSRATKKRTYEDETALLLLNAALQTNNYLTTEDQKVLFALPNGASVTLLFRKKGERMQTYFTKPLEIVNNQIAKPREQSSTRNYYLITKDYVIETDFIFSSLFSTTS